MAHFDLSESAQADLQEITAYTMERWGAAQARKYLEELQARLAHLAEQPLIGRRRDELATGVLSFPCESHVIYYTRADFGILVVRMLHRRQDPHRHIE